VDFRLCGRSRRFRHLQRSPRQSDRRSDLALQAGSRLNGKYTDSIDLALQRGLRPLRGSVPSSEPNSYLVVGRSLRNIFLALQAGLRHQSFRQGFSLPAERRSLEQKHSRARRTAAAGSPKISARSGPSSSAPAASVSDRRRDQRPDIAADGHPHYGASPRPSNMNPRSWQTGLVQTLAQWVGSVTSGFASPVTQASACRTGEATEKTKNRGGRRGGHTAERLTNTPVG
jgi:hypothetical protein